MSIVTLEGAAGWRLRRKQRMIRLMTACAFAVGFLIGARAASAAAVSLPPVNLGDTSFLDGVAFPGGLVEETIGYYHADQINNQEGSSVPGSNKVTTLSATTHFAYITNYRLLGGYYGAELLLPLADVDVNTSFGPKERERGIGDLIVSPFMLQWTDHKLLGMPYFHRFVVDITLPTGSYDRTHAVNAGSNLISVNPYYAFTIMPTEKLEVSARLHYLWNSENDSPYAGSAAENIQPGQAFHANYAASYEVTKGVRFGINGYALQQLTDDKVNGHKQPSSEERVFGIGPGVQFSGHGVSLFINSYFETGAENRPEGTKVAFRLSKTF